MPGAHGMPGVKTLWRGLQRLKDMSEIWLLMGKILDCPLNMGNL